MDSDTPTTGERTKGSPWNKVFWLFVILIGAALAVFFSFVWLTKHGIDTAKKGTIELITAFRPEEVVETFEEWKDFQAEGNEGNILEVATATSTELFTRKTNVSMFGKILPLGTTVSEISVPATYRYHIDLNGEWFLTSDGNRLLVLAPPLKPSLPVAFDTAGVQKKTKSGWARWDGDENLEELEKTITSKLEARAGSSESIELAREEARESVAKFVESWLVSREAWETGKIESISVVFDGEEDKSLSTQPPSLEIEVTPVSEETISSGLEEKSDY